MKWSKRPLLLYLLTYLHTSSLTYIHTDDPRHRVSCELTKSHFDILSLDTSVSNIFINHKSWLFQKGWVTFYHSEEKIAILKPSFSIKENESKANHISNTPSTTFLEYLTSRQGEAGNPQIIHVLNISRDLSKSRIFSWIFCEFLIHHVMLSNKFIF